ncbi:MAG: AAA family ATPase [Patescibacteria group bacterium]
MKIKRLKIENFRSIKSLDIELDDTSVFIGANNAGKSSILEAVRIALSRRWGQQGTGFTEDDIHLVNDKIDPRNAPPVKIRFEFEEGSSGEWPTDMVAELEQIMTLTPTNLNKVTFTISYIWNPEKELFETTWQFLNSSGDPFPSASRSVNFSGFFNYIIFLWVGALRDADDEFTSHSRNWGGLLKSIKIPKEIEEEIKNDLDVLDEKLLRADPKFLQISETIGKATEITIENGPGSAKIRMLPINVWDMITRAGIILKNEDLRPWLPLNHHGQGLQSLSIIFLCHAAAAQKLVENNFGAEPIYAIEEPEVHLHPQAARTLWSKMTEIAGQKLITTHSPYFVQNVPLHSLRVVRLQDDSTSISFLPKKIESDIPWTEDVENFVKGAGRNYFKLNKLTNSIDAIQSFDENIMNDLVHCWKVDNDDLISNKIKELRRKSSVLVSEEEERNLSFQGRRIRGEIFFARFWVLAEGVSEYLLLKAIGDAYEFDLDQYGVAIIDFQNNGRPDIYAALAEAFKIPWFMITDGDGAGEAMRKQLSKRGFDAKYLQEHSDFLQSPNTLEAQLLADGNGPLLRKIIADTGDTSALTCSVDDFKNKLSNKKTPCMSRLASLVSRDITLAKKMPEKFISIIERIKSDHQL